MGVARLATLRVGLNLTFLGERAGGVGRYAQELAAALAAREDIELHVVASRDLPAEVRTADWAARARWTTLPISAASPRRHLAGQFALLPALALAHRWDVLHSPANAGPVLVPGVACVITMHDVIWLDAPEQWGTPEAVRAMHRTAIPTVRRATLVLAGSHTAARALVRGLHLDPARIVVAAHGVHGPAPTTLLTPEPELRRRLDLGAGPVVLCVAQKRPYKNQEALVRALAQLARQDVRLVLPGSSTEYERQLREIATAYAVQERVVFVDWVDDADLEGLYGLARCVALPSRHEGFGLPVLEAMVRGVPVACSSIEVLREVAGGAALLFDPDDDTTLASSLGRLLDDDALRADLARRGRERAAAFTWEATADATVRAYAQARDRSPPSG